MRIKPAQFIRLYTGYREFDQYLNASNLLPSKALFEEALDAMKQSTREYAAQQTSAIRNNLLPIINASNRSGSSNGTLLYMLDATSEPMPSVLPKDKYS